MKIERFFNCLLSLASAVLLGILSLNTVLFTQRYGRVELGEIINGAPIYEIRDNVLLHIVGALVVFIFIFVLVKVFGYLGKNTKGANRVVYIVQALLAIGAGLISFAILKSGFRTPLDDQIQVFSAACLFNTDNYINLSKGGYIHMYPQQLGYVGYLQLLFRLFGKGDFYIAQVANCFWIAGTVYMLCQCVNLFTKDNVVRVLSAGLFTIFLPLLLMSSWVYGDVPSLFFVALAYWRFLRMKKRMSVWDVVAFVLSFVLAVLLRKNALIFVLGFIVALIFEAIRSKKIIYVGISALILCLPLLAVNAVESYYEKVSGYEVDGGIPSTMWITMGMLEGDAKPGWFNNFCVPNFYAVDCDREKAKEIALDRMQERLAEFKENPISAISFYKRKISTQWNDPLFGTIKMIEPDDVSAATGISKFICENQHGMMVCLSMLQSVIYIGAFLYCALAAGKKSIAENVMLITLIGGFLFSILWEANSRYIFPYVYMLFPMTAAGWKMLYDKCVIFLTRKRGKN